MADALNAEPDADAADAADALNAEPDAEPDAADAADADAAVDVVNGPTSLCARPGAPPNI
jgi:hypothetical protein